LPRRNGQDLEEAHAGSSQDAGNITESSLACQVTSKSRGITQMHQTWQDTTWHGQWDVGRLISHTQCKHRQQLAMLHCCTTHKHKLLNSVLLSLHISSPAKYNHHHRTGILDN